MKTSSPRLNCIPTAVAMLLLSLLVLLCATGYAAKTKHTSTRPAYATYCNARFGFTVRYPRSLKMGPPPENDDGREFLAKDGFSMTASGINNAADDTLASEMAEWRRDFTRVTYQATGRNWFVLSGTKAGKIIYVKAYVGKGSINHLYITYPAKLKTKYRKVVATISSSFKPGNLAEGGWAQ